MNKKFKYDLSARNHDNIISGLIKTLKKNPKSKI